MWTTFVLLLALLRTHRTERAHEASLAGLAWFAAAYVLLLFPVAFFGPIALAEQAWQALRSARDDVHSVRRNVVRAGGFVLATMALYSCLTALILLFLIRIINIPLVTDFWFWCIVLGASLIGLPITLLLVRDLRRWELWDGLVLDDSQQQGAAPTSA